MEADDGHAAREGCAAADQPGQGAVRRVWAAALAPGRQRALRWMRAPRCGVPAMSAKGRREGGSVPFDYYPTPAWCVDRLLDDCAADLFEVGEYWIEPTVGDGAIVRAVKAWHEAAGIELGGRWDACELRPNAGAADCVDNLQECDFRLVASYLEWDACIGNPPYALAESITRHALETSARVAFLLRVGFLGSLERVPFWQTHGDVALRVLPDRPSFDGEGTDSATYAWFIWGCPGVTGVKVLDPTPVAVRNAQKPSNVPTCDPLQRGLFEAAE